MFRIQVTEEEFNTAAIGDEWWQRVPDEDDTAVFIVTQIKAKRHVKNNVGTAEYYILAGGFEHEPAFVSGVSGLRATAPQEVVKESGTQQALLERSA